MDHNFRPKAIFRRILPSSFEVVAEEEEDLKKIPETPPVESKLPDPIFVSIIKAYEAKDLIKAKELFSNSGLPINYQEPTRANRTLLLYAAKFDVTESVDELLKNGADFDIADDSGVTPLHSAASNGSLKSVQRLLLAGSNANALDAHCKTPLHYATRAIADEGNENSVYSTVQALLDAGALLGSKDKEDKVPLHSAAAVGNVPVLQVLLSRTGSSLATARDKDGRIPLHLAVIGGRSLQAVKLLLQCDCSIDAKDAQGRTSLHHVAARPINYADEDFDGECLEMLLSHGASVAAQDDEGHNALSLALQKTMWWNRASPRDSVLHSVQMLVVKGSAITNAFDMWRIVDTFPSLVNVALNQSIRTNTSARDSPYLKLKLDFRPLTANGRLLEGKMQQKQTPVASKDQPQIPSPLLIDSEISVLRYIVDEGHKEILTHPLCSMFLHLKWLKVRKFFVINAIYYFLFVITFTGFILNPELCPNNSTHTKNAYFPTWNGTKINDTSCESLLFEFENVSYILLLIFSVSLAFRELILILHSPLFYITNLENYLDCTILTCVLMLLFWTDRPMHFQQWERNIASILAVFAWSRLMLFLGQFPSCGVYIVMFSTVFQTIVKFLAMYLPLLVAFALGLFIILEDIIPFHGFPISIMTTVVMMTGELDYGEKILSNEFLGSKLYPCILLVFFILMVYIILSNLLVALAVSDLHSIQQRSEILRLTSQVELMITVETFLRSPIMPKRFRDCLLRKISIGNGRSDASIIIFPNLRHSYTDSLFNIFVSIFSCRPLFIKIFEHFITNFIPPEPAPSLPSNLIKEAVALALTELEIEKRDKLFAAKIRQNKNIVPSFPTLTPKATGTSAKEGGSFKVRQHVTWFEDAAADLFPALGRGYEHQLNPTPSMRASIWKSSFRKNALLTPNQAEVKESEAATDTTIDELKNKIQTLQSAIETLTARLPQLPIRPSLNRETTSSFRVPSSTNRHPQEAEDYDHNTGPSSPLLLRM